MERINRINMALQAMNGLGGFTSKMVIAGHDMYVKTVLDAGRLVFVDVIISAPRGVGPEHVQTARAEATKTDNARAMVEMLCRQADLLLQSEVWTWEDLCMAWAGTRFEPDGVCFFPHGEVGTVSSPLDAVARLVRMRFEAWRGALEVADDVMVGVGLRAGTADRSAGRVLGADG